jgi:uncharacterized protein YqgC (DUF456 family)
VHIDWSSALPITAHVLLVLCTLGGLVGSFFPAFPGAVLIWAGALLHGLLTGWEPLGMPTQLTLAGLMAVAAAGQFAISAAGAKRFGSSGWGVLGAGLGMLIGTFAIPVPIVGSLLGAFLGALVLELTVAQPRAARRTDEATGEGARSAPEPTRGGRSEDVGKAARAGFGAAVGAVLGMMAEIGVAFVMVGVILAGLLF